MQPSLNRITRGATLVHLRPKLMDLLVELAKRAGEVVPKEVLIEAVWARKFVAESALSTAVAGLRKELGEEAGEPRYIESVPKRGYRLVAAVEPVEHDAAGQAGATCCSSSAVGACLSGRVNTSSAARRRGGTHDSTDVSRHHARIVVRAGAATIEDLGSKNGTFVGGERVTEPRALCNGDQVRVGGVLIVFRLPRHMQSTMTVEGG